MGKNSRVARAAFYKPGDTPREPNSPTVKHHLSTVTFQNPPRDHLNRARAASRPSPEKTSGPAHQVELALRVGEKANRRPHSVRLKQEE
jgi:hypothetical protein